MFALLRHFAYYHYYCDYYYLRRTILFPSDVFVRRDATKTVARGAGGRGEGKGCRWWHAETNTTIQLI